METKPLFEVANDSNPRGSWYSLISENITEKEYDQVILDLKYWFESHAKPVITEIQNSKPASQEQQNELKKSFKVSIPDSILKILSLCNGGFQLHEGYKTLSIADILESLEEHEVDFHWNKNYIPFAKDISENFLILEMEGSRIHLIKAMRKNS